MRVSSSKLEGTLLNDRKEAAVDYVANGYGTQALDSTGKSVVQEEETGCRDLSDRKPHHQENAAD